MEAAMAALVTLYLGASIYLLTSTNLIRILLGVALLGNGVNLLIFTAGRIAYDVPPIIPADRSTLAGPTANPLPQAMILTAIVIGFALFAFLMVLAYRAYQEIGTSETDQMHQAEPKSRLAPPEGY